MGKGRDNLKYMQGRFGTTDKGACRDCCHCLTRQLTGRVIHKCEVYGDSDSMATDFPVSFFGCGLFNKETLHRDLYKERKHRPKEDLQEETLF